MPARNVVKDYIEDGYYHLYNRGVDKRDIFLDEQDCIVLLHYLRIYLSPIEELLKENRLGTRIQRLISLNLSGEIDLLSFSLMPNHIHFQVKQHTRDGITKLMRRVITSYVMYFNKKYKRVGTLFQGIYRAAFIKSEAQHLHLSRYIHLNPIRVKSSINFMSFSSYPYYLGKKHASWVKPEEILSYFKKAKKESQQDILSYQSFVEDYLEDSNEIIADLLLEKGCFD